MIVDLRSDTFTRPGKGMLQAMYDAEVGDDVFEEDPSVNKLEQMAASIFGMEAAIYCPTGTMSNQIAIKVHTQPGDEVICERNSHIYQYEGGGIAFNAGCQVNLIDGEFGKITAQQVKSCVNADDVHKAVSRLVSLENTANRGGGSCYDFNEIKKIRAACDEHNLSLHLDGARLFNAIVAKKETPKQYGEVFHSVSICLNKGLGCPIGSILISNQKFIRKARRIRKVFGGGMRQAGFMAATGIYALQHNIERLVVDHERAKAVGEAISNKSFCARLYPVETNIVIFEADSPEKSKELLQRFKAENVLVIPMSPVQIRFVFHLDIDENMFAHVLKVISQL